MLPGPTDDSEREHRLDLALGAYFEAAAAGQPIDRDEFLGRHQDLAAELARFFAAEARLDFLTAPLRPPASPGLPETPSPGAYEVLGELGRGGMGVVFKARQKGLGRLVALKMIRGDRLGSPEQVRRFRAEAEAAARLDHPNVVSIYEVGECDGQPFFSMELLEGGSLAEHLPRYTADPRLAAELIGVVARAVHHAHQRGILHRDLKPSNVLLDGEGRPHVADFGLAKWLEADSGLTDTGVLLGTPSYAAPEQASAGSAAVTTATDVYGLGVLLYALVTGRPPFQGETPFDTLLQVKEREPESPRAVNPRVDRDLAVICLKCLEKEPRRRYGSAAALAEDLERWLAGKPIVARPISPITRLGRWCRRNPAVAALAAVSLCLVATLLGLGFGATLQQARKAGQAEEAIAAALDQVDRALASGRQTDAALELDRAEKLASNAAATVRQRFAARFADLGMLIKLEDIRLRQREPGPFYAAAFRQDGIDVENLEPAEAARLVRERTIRGALVAALDDWARSTPDGKRRQRLRAVAEAADDQPEALVGQLRRALAGGDRNALLELAAAVRGEELPPSVLVALATGLREQGEAGKAVPLLQAGLARHPGDFWLNLELGSALMVTHPSEPAEARSYLRAAFALSDGNPSVYMYAGNALFQANRWSEAVAMYRQAILVKPDYVEALNNCGNALTQLRHYDEAVEAFDEAIRIRPNYGHAYFNRGCAFDEQGKTDEALASYRRAIESEPRYAEAYYNSAFDLLYKEDKFAEAETALDRGWQFVAAEDPSRGNWPVLRDECRRCLALEPRLTAVLQGAEPDGADEACQLALLFSYQQRFGWAARLYGQAFRLDPARADNLQQGYRYWAAGCAAQAGCGRGRDAEQLDDGQRAHWRGKALEWLRADLSLRREQIRSGTPEEKKDARGKLGYWEGDARLACVRDPKPLAGLPEAEREGWRGLWQEVAALRR
jgi:eukaryotic-like serine/threonine-protein kinase